MNPNCRHEAHDPDAACLKCIDIGCHVCDLCQRIRELEKLHDKVWFTHELQNDFEVRGFGLRLCVVKRKSDGALGSLEFDHMPRIYYDFMLHE